MQIKNININLSLLLAGCLSLFTMNSDGQPQIAGVLESAFKHPPVTARPKALWPWTNGNVSLQQISFELEEAKRKGMGGFDIWDIGTMVDPNGVVPPGPAFLGKESVQAIAHTIREADRIGMEIGLTFSSSWNAGGAWVKPEHGAMGLFRKDTVVQGPQQFIASIAFPSIPDKYGNRQTILHHDPATDLPVFYKEVAMLAHSLRPDSTIDHEAVIVLGGNVRNDTLRWEVPAGRWRIIRYVCAPTGQPLAIPSPASKGLMLDHFSAAAQQANMDHIFNQLLPATGSLKNRSLKYLYADSYEVNSAVWTPLLPEEFFKRNKYSLTGYLPVLDGFTIGNEETSDRFRYDFTKTLSDLIIENHYRLGRIICERYGIGFNAEAGGPGQPIHNVPFEDLKALGALTVPRGEFWNKHPQLELLQIIKGISSASHIYNQKYVEAESFTSVWLWQEGPDELKPLADRALCEGLNRFVYHTFPHTVPESGFPGWVYNFGTLINTTNGWWPQSGGFHEYLARCSYLLQQGNFVGDIAYYYGDRAPNFVAPKHIDSTLGFGYDYDAVNSDIILNKMQVKNGRIYLPHGQYYEVLVLPHEKAVNPLVLKKLEQMVAAGATIVGPKPSRSYGLFNREENDKLVRTIADALWGGCDSIHSQEHAYGKGKVIWGRKLRDVLLQKGVRPDVQTDMDSIDFIHRSTGAAEIYFIRNSTKETISGTITFRKGQGQPQFWNPETGEIIRVPCSRQANGAARIPLSLTGYGSCFIVFKPTDPKRTGIAPGNEQVVEKQHAGATVWYTEAGIISEDDNKSSLPITNPWILHFDQAHTTLARDTMSTLIPLNESIKDAVRYYSGNVTYTTSFMLDKNYKKADHRAWLDLGKVKEIATVFVNGKQAGVCWHAPYRVDITDALNEGENYLQVAVVNTINNRLVGDARLPEQSRRIRTNITKLSNAWRQPFAQAPLLEAGLIGPVQIVFLPLVK